MQRNLLALNRLDLWKKSKTIITCREDFIQSHEKQVLLAGTVLLQNGGVCITRCGQIMVWWREDAKGIDPYKCPHFSSYLACHWKVHLPQ